MSLQKYFSKENNSNEKNKSGRRGVTRIIWASYYSWCGFYSAIKHETAFRQELLLFIFMFPFVFWVGDNIIEYLLLLGSGLLVLIVELLNSSIEAVVDRIGVEHHTLSGRAKDMGSAAVFISIVFLLICWSSLSFQHFGKF